MCREVLLLFKVVIEGQTRKHIPLTHKEKTFGKQI